MILLRKIQLWRIYADFCTGTNWRLPESATRVSVSVVAGPSNKKPATNCQNRYPSPSKRSDHFLIRPLNFSGIRRRIAQTITSPKKTFANMGQIGACEDIDNYGKGLRACKINYGQSQSQGFWYWQLVVTQCWSRAFWALVPAQAPQSFWAEMRQQALLLVGLVTSFIASKTHHSADPELATRAKARSKHFNGHRGFAPVAVCRLTSCGHGSAHHINKGMTQCSRKS